MEARWFTSDSYLCDKCNMVRDATRLVEESIDPKTGNPVGVIELKCGHAQKVMRVSREINIAPLFQNTKKITVEPQVRSGVPSVSVSGGGQIILGGKVELSNIHNTSLVMNMSVNVYGDNAVVRQNTTLTDIQTDLNAITQTIERDLPNEDQRKEVMSILEEIKNDLGSQRIPHSQLSKLQKFEKIYGLVQPWALKAVDYVFQNGSLPL